MRIYDLKNVSKCYTFGKITSSLPNVLNKMSKSLDDDRKPITRRRSNRSLMVNVTPNCEFKDSIVFIHCNCGFNGNILENVNTLLSKFNEIFSKTNTYVFFIRGGYENPKWFDGETINFSNIKAIEDYSFVKTQKMNILCIGGDIAFDKNWVDKNNNRNGNELFDEDTKPYFNEDLLKQLFSENTVHAIITSSSPSFLNPSLNTLSKKPWLCDSNKELESLWECRIIMDKIYSVISSNLYNKPYVWVYNNFTNKGYNMDTYNDILFYLPNDSDFYLLGKLINDYCQYNTDDDGVFLPNGIGLRNKIDNSNEYNGILGDELDLDRDYEDIARMV